MIEHLRAGGHGSLPLFRCHCNFCRFDKGAAGLFAPLGDGQKALIPGNIVGRIASILRARPHPRCHRKDSVVVGLLCFYLARAPGIGGAVLWGVRVASLTRSRPTGQLKPHRSPIVCPRGNTALHRYSGHLFSAARAAGLFGLLVTRNVFATTT
ncbi:hypothetical protein MRX96_010402 [Rhipicephalus microplus]